MGVTLSFLQDFLFYSSGNECPEDFLIWSGISLLSAVAGRKIWTKHGSFIVDPRLYVCMVGSPNSGKSTAMEQAEKLYIANCPDYFISESIQSREDILNKMSSPACERTITLVDGSIMTWRPFYCLVDEMENFVSIGRKNGENTMVATLVGMFNRDSFGTGFKTDVNKNQRLYFPYLNMLGCTIPEWMMSSMRQSLFVGGLGRRLVIVHARKTKEVPNPCRPLGSDSAWLRMCEHLKTIEKHSGELTKTIEAQKWWNRWYMDPKRKNKMDPILIQFHEGQHTIVQKVAIDLALSENSQALVIDQPHLEGAYLMLKKLEPEIIRLTSGIGRNELAGVGAQLLDFIDRMGGVVPEIEIKKQFRRYLQDREFLEVLQSYQNTQELFVATDPMSTPQRVLYFLPRAYEGYLARLAAKQSTAVGSESAGFTNNLEG